MMNQQAPTTIDDETLDFTIGSGARGTTRHRERGKMPLATISSGSQLRAAVTFFASTFKVYCLPLVDEKTRTGTYHGQHPCFTPESFAFAQNDPELMRQLHNIMIDTDHNEPIPDGENDPMARVRAAVHAAVVRFNGLLRAGPGEGGGSQAPERDARGQFTRRTSASGEEDDDDEEDEDGANEDPPTRASKWHHPRRLTRRFES